MRAEWRKSTFSGTEQPDCVEVAYATEVRLRDSKNPDAGTLTIPTYSWKPLLLAVKGR
ncbi:MAG TPA: DUF397 domain-containing protein [Actinokineospora sp.]|jgi:hypothetical protein|nr:DUF397 domain-containing protein [Actinokineospora sp.]